MVVVSGLMLALAVASSGDCSDRATFALEAARDARAIANDLHRMRGYYHDEIEQRRELIAESSTGDEEPADVKPERRYSVTALGWYDQFSGIPACVDGRPLRTSLTRGWFGAYIYDEIFEPYYLGAEAYFLAAGDALRTGDGREIPFRQRLFGLSVWWSEWIAVSLGLTLDLPPTATDQARLAPAPRIVDAGLNLYLSLGVPFAHAFVDVVARPGARQIDLATVSGRDVRMGVDALRGFGSVGYVTREDKAVVDAGLRWVRWARAEVAFEATPVAARSVALRFEPEVRKWDELRGIRPSVIPYVEASLFGGGYFQTVTGAGWIPGLRAGVGSSLSSTGASLGFDLHVGMNSHEELSRVPALLGTLQWGMRLSFSMGN